MSTELENLKAELAALAGRIAALAELAGRIAALETVEQPEAEWPKIGDTYFYGVAGVLQEMVEAPGPAPVAYIEHHKGGDNLVWDNPGGKYSVLYTVPPAQSEPVGYLYTNVQSGEYHVSDYDDDYRGPERALWCIEPVYRRARGQS